MKRRTMITAPLLLASCGGGGGGGPKLAIDLLGDSVPSGRLQVPPAPYERLPRPVSLLLYEQTLRPVFDYTAPGARIAQALGGGLGFGQLADHVKETPAATIILWYGGADAVLGTQPADFERDLAAAARLVRAAGADVVLVTTYQHPDPGVQAASRAITEAVRRVGCALRIPVADLWDTPVGFADPVHPDQATAVLFAQQVARLILHPDQGVPPCPISTKS